MAPRSSSELFAYGANVIAHGSIRLLGARIGGNINLRHGQIINPTELALSVERARIGGDILLRHAILEGGVFLQGSTIEGDVRFDEARLSVGVWKKMFDQSSVLAERAHIG